MAPGVEVGRIEEGVKMAKVVQGVNERPSLGYGLRPKGEDGGQCL